MVRILLPTLLLTLLLSASSLAQDKISNPDVRTRNIPVVQVGEHPESENQFLRRLSDSDSNDSNDNANEDDAYNNDDANVLNRVREDFNSMWGIPPNEWSQEYWQVLGGFLFVILFSLSVCMGCCCLLPLWVPREEPTVLKPLGNNNGLQSGSPPDNTATKNKDVNTSNNDTLQSQVSIDAPIVEGPPSLVQPVLVPSKSIMAAPSLGPSLAPSANIEKTLSYDTYGSGYVTPGSPRGSTNKKSRQSLWSQKGAVWEEVVSVWSEFLGCSDEKQDQQYEKFKEPVLTASMRSKSRSRSRSKKSKASRRYKAPSLRKKSDIEYETAASSQNEHKVAAHDGAVV